MRCRCESRAGEVGELGQPRPACTDKEARQQQTQNMKDRETPGSTQGNRQTVALTGCLLARR